MKATVSEMGLKSNCPLQVAEAIGGTFEILMFLEFKSSKVTPSYKPWFDPSRFVGKIGSYGSISAISFTF